MRRCVVVLALLIGVGVCLVACGREEGGSPTTADLSGGVSDAKPPPEFSGVLVSVNEQEKTFALEGSAGDGPIKVTRWFQCVHERQSWPLILKRWESHPNVTVSYFESEDKPEGITLVMSVYFEGEHDSGMHTLEEVLDLPFAPKFSGVLVSVNEQDRTFALEGRSEGESDDVTRWFRCVHERYSWPFILERWKDHPNVTVYYFEGEENADGPTPVASVYFGSEYDTGRHTWDESLDLSSASKDPA